MPQRDPPPARAYLASRIRLGMKFGLETMPALVAVDRDQEAHLGTSLAAIAREKAGVLRRGRVTVLGPLSDEARDAIQVAAGRRGARVAEVAVDRVGPRPGGRVDVVTPRRVH